MRILVVDDDKDLRQAMAAMLEMLGDHQIIQAEDGAEGARIFENQKAFDLVMSDFMMPRMNGLRLLRHIRERRGDLALPFIMATSDPGRAERAILEVYSVKALDQIEVLGAFTILDKPFGLTDLENAMEKVGCNMDDEPKPQADEALELIKRAHRAMDALFAELIVANGKPQTHFLPSKSGEPWDVMTDLYKFIQKHERVEEVAHESQGSGS